MDGARDRIDLISKQTIEVELQRNIAPTIIATIDDKVQSTTLETHRRMDELVQHLRNDVTDKFASISENMGEAL